MAMAISCIIAARHPELGEMFAMIDPADRFVAGEVRPSRFAASLAPFRDAAAAEAALLKLGAEIETRQ